MSTAGRSFQTYTSSYKACRLSSNEYLPFDKVELINAFDREIINEYGSPLRRMCKFTAEFVDEKNMGNWLVRAVLETIRYDDSIKDELFYVGTNGQPMDKKHLLSAQYLDLQPFLLGIWHFILMNRPSNTVGRNTFLAWHQKPSSNRGKWQFISDIGKNLNFIISVNIISEHDISQNSENAGNNDGSSCRLPIGKNVQKVNNDLQKGLPFKEHVMGKNKYARYLS